MTGFHRKRGQNPNLIWGELTHIVTGRLTENLIQSLILHVQTYFY